MLAVLCLLWLTVSITELLAVLCLLWLTVFITELLAVLCLLWLTVSITEPCCAVLAHTRSCRGVEAAALPMARCQTSH